jgi:ATP-dependent Clp protease ATP-binding subunit ClpB
MQLGSLPLPIDRKERELSSFIVKQEALKREDSPAAQSRRRTKIAKEIARLKRRARASSWEME